MTETKKMMIWGAGAVVFLGAVWLWYGTTKTDSSLQGIMRDTSSMRMVGEENTMPRSPSGNSRTDDSTLPTSKTDASDQAIDKDTQALDAQLNVLQADNASVDSGIQEGSAVQ